jgi:glycogen(starch) synthase
VRIAHIGPSNHPILFNRGGAIERRIVEMAQVQAKGGHSVVVYSAESACAETSNNGYRLRALKCNRKGTMRRFEFLRKAAADLRRNPVDLIHVHSAPEAIWFLSGASALKILSYDFFRSRGWRYFPMYDIYRWTLNRYDYLLPVSEFCMAESARFWKLTGDRMRVLHNGVNLEQFQPDGVSAQAQRERLGLGNDPVLLYVGRVCEQKGTDILIDAYLGLKARIPNVRLVVAGPAEQFGNAGSSPLVERIQSAGGLYLGAVDESELAATYNLATIFVMATRREEMFGMAAIEAQACGKPVVCSRQGGLPEVIPESSGVHFRVGDAMALAAALERVIRDKGLYDSLSVAARRNAARFCWDKVVQELNDICFGAPSPEFNSWGLEDGALQK